MPATPPPTPPVNAAGEEAFLAWVRQRQLARPRPRHLLETAGDDLALLEWQGGLVLVGMDPVLDGVHVDLPRHGPTAAGRKAMNRNLSDVAAMVGEPVAATLSIVAPRSMPLEAVQAVYLGAEEAGESAGCPIAGGDFASWDGRLVVTVGILGRVDRAVLRGGARVGDRIFVSGPLGGSILGRHLTFAPRLDLGRQLGELGATAMLDISDGLSRDLPRLIRPVIGATVDAEAVPIHADAAALAQQTGRDPLWHALHDGEDYELLFTAAMVSVPGCIAIGHVEAEPGVRIRRAGRVEPLAALGWEHALGASEAP